MQPLAVYSVIPKLPKALTPLWELAYNFWFEWNHDITDLFAQMDPGLWRQSRNNPVWFLNHLPQATLEAAAQDDFFLERLREVHKGLVQYLGRKVAHVSFEARDGNAPVVAYFSAEYGLALSLPIYSGGLGILAGDHLKSSSDLNIPLVGIGLCYLKGYFRQSLTQDGWQNERYVLNDFNQMPLVLVMDRKDQPIKIEIYLAGETLTAQIWQASVGRVNLYLLDTNVPENPPHLKEVTSQLYGGGLEMRLKQEILLGIGGIKALRALGLSPKVIHMNEGHSAFAGLERIRDYMAGQGLSFEAAQELVASSSVFTTHTPVPAGNDRFPAELMERYFPEYAKSLGLAFKVFLALGRENPRDDAEPFCMTVLALRLSRFNNGVSQVHGAVSRKMWEKVWPQYPAEDIPIGAITNGVHVPSWVSRDFAQIYDRYLGINWREDPDSDRVWKQADSIPDSELWRTHERLRERLTDFTRERLKEQVMNRGGRTGEIQTADEVLDPQALTIGFARRFATYKRGNLLLQDRERLLRLVKDRQRPVQFIFAGKAHPQDTEGKKIIQQLSELCQSEDFRHHIVFIEDYDMEISSHLYQGCDVWLNTPRPPLEACGTSGMKAMANGVLNVSAFDGWWAEAYAPDNSLGWTIGLGEVYEDQVYQDFLESQILYNILEREVIPQFYDRGHGNLPRGWVQKMKRGLTALGPVYNSHRMALNYAKQAYLPAAENFTRLSKDQYTAAKGLASWRMGLMTKWGALQIRNVKSEAAGDIYVNQPLIIRAEIFLDGLSSDDIQVEIYAGPLNHEGHFINRRLVGMSAKGQPSDGWLKYEGRIAPDQTGRFGYTVRILPHHPLLLDPHCLGLIHWAKTGN